MSNDNPSEKSPLKKKMGLGRGLDALLGEALRGDSMAAKSNADMDSRGQGVATLLVIDIRPNPDQPRRHFADEKLDELAASIAKHGIIQPIIVRPFQGGYQIVAGERRWRAAQRAQLHDIPAIIRSFDDSETLEIALLENIQRQDLNPIEEAEAYKKLTELFGHSAGELAELPDDHPLKDPSGPAAEFLDDGVISKDELSQLGDQLHERRAADRSDSTNV